MYHFFLIFILFIIVIIVIVNICMYKERQNLVLQEGLTNNNNNTTIILIGDSILNNTNYILTQGKSVPDLIKAENNDTLLFAKDHAVITDCYTQIEQIPAANNTENTYIFVSAGGNNILNGRSNLSNEMVESFFQQYSTLLNSLKTNFQNSQIYLLNLYYPLDSRFTNLYPFIDQWNSLLSEFADNNDLEIIKTNKMIVSKADLTNAIEPSETGGNKIANAILDISKS